MADRHKYADALIEFVKGCDIPMTIALQGDWGSGKKKVEKKVGSGLVT